MLTLVVQHSLNWALRGARDAAAMLWMTFWPLVLGFSLSGCVQAFARRGALRRSLGVTTLGSTARASMLGVISSSCSYAASAMARSLFSAGASWSNSMVFMIASTNLVVELGVVLYVLLGWQFLIAELAGGVIMIALLALVLPRVFNRTREAQLRERVGSANKEDEAKVVSLRNIDGWSRASRYAAGDLTMLRKELFIGFVVAGYIAADVPASWWRAIFLTGHGPWTIIENVAVAPLIAVASFVCSVGNIPLAAALWSRGVAFGGVIAFIFADLVTLPLLMIYRRFYGTRAAAMILFTFWGAMSLAGLAIEGAFRSVHAVPLVRRTAITDGQFDLGWTLGLNLVAVVVIGVGMWLARRSVVDEATAIDPVCSMQVERASAPARREHAGATYYFCSPRCADRFEATPERFLGTPIESMQEQLDGDAIDPVCMMRVNSSSPAATALVEGANYYFCSTGCRDRFLAGERASTPVAQPLNLTKKTPR